MSADLAHFESLYGRSRDPWRMASSPYEQARYAHIIAALGREPVRLAYEPGCAIGELTVLLAERCDAVVASDFCAAAVATARKRCARHVNVSIQLADLRTTAAPEETDLVVLAEVGYYFDHDTLAVIVERMTSALAAGGRLLACHWTGVWHTHPLSAEAVHGVIESRAELEVVRSEYGAAGEYLVGIWRKR